MNALRIHGGRRLTGEWRVHSAKNAVLPIMAASILTGEATRLEGCPELVDVAYMADILRTLGCRIHSGDGALTIDPQGLNRHEMPDALAKKIRSSIFLLGSILARFRKATVTFPGGCEIGLRPIDLHLSGLRQLGVDVREEGGLIRCDGRHMRAGTVHFDYPSVGATENVMMAAVLLKGRTVLSNVAREPEIVDLQNLLNAMGARISGAGTHTVTVEGVERLHGVSYAGPHRGRDFAGCGGGYGRRRPADQCALPRSVCRLYQAAGNGLRDRRGGKRGEAPRAAAAHGLPAAANAAASGLSHRYAGPDAGAGRHGKGNLGGGGERI